MSVSATGFEEDIMGVGAGKDFALIRLASGKVRSDTNCHLGEEKI